MSSLYKRATPSQRRILRIVEGCVKNAGDAHPAAGITPRLARSIAKRAAGTLTAQWPDVLAARMPSDRVGGDIAGLHQPQASQPMKASGRGPRQFKSRSLVPQLVKWCSMRVGPAKRAGKMERAEALIEVLRQIAKLQGQ